MEKNYVIRCKNCKWSQPSTGVSADLTDLHEIKGCANCSGRRFRCPKCGQIAKMFKKGKN